jgi:cob(I)alamin adenosyltransferase
MSERQKMRGYVEVYTGDGKGKTTAALGLALRAAGAGLKVYFAQFIKGMKYSEHKALERFGDLIAVKQYGRNCFINDKPEAEDVRIARDGLIEAREIMLSGRYQVIVLDEANIATHYNLFTADELLDLIRVKPLNVEIVITGRYADQRIIDAADLVTEMKEVKHYYKNGISAREGIEK